MPKTLHEGLDAIRTNFLAQAPTEVSDIVTSEVTRIVHQADQANPAAAGSRIEDFKLPDAKGDYVSLDDVIAEGPAVIVFYRGAWCPFCNLTLRTYQQELFPQLKERGIGLVAISPQLPDGSLSSQESNALEFTVLSDVSNRVARSLGIVFTMGSGAQTLSRRFGIDVGAVNGTGEWELPHPTVLIIDRHKKIQFIDVHPDYTTRTEPARILAALDSSAGDKS
ncbi:peroxiredoxin-like family protein [Fodinicola feengrottensis]|uniref:thioredoxin-dependent peroxiredoxin n=1 Tax=Fodinicola feengrottensis TaxID=435914 RepID=A0ABP4TLC8_9ACTN|nr:peroxiredoxin-like family protein [Fodinicola feengrottensis]